MNSFLKDVIILKTDVLVIGGGGAALRAALAAKQSGVDVLLISKGKSGKSGATYSDAAEIGAFNVPDGYADSTDSPDEFYNDIMKAAQGMAVPELARIVADESEEAMRYLESCGMEFSKNIDGSYNIYKACFSSKARSHVVKDHFKPILKVLKAKAETENIQMIDGLSLTNLIVHNAECYGAFAVDIHNELYVLQAKSVILATGGASILFKHNMYPNDVTGDGYAAAYRAGASITNMEFIQAGLGLAYPIVNLFGNQLWEAMPKLTNSKEENFIKKYSPYPTADIIREKVKHFPFSVTDISRYIEISVQKEITEGNPTEHGNILLDFFDTDFDLMLKDNNSSFKNTWPITYDKYLKNGIDLYKERIEIACFAHAINGGILIDEHAESSIKGLFAAGEVASGPHGADRLGGNMSVTCQVFGKRAGEYAAKRAKQNIKIFDYYNAITNEKSFLNGFYPITSKTGEIVLEELQEFSDKCLLIVRKEERLKIYLSELERLENNLYEKAVSGSLYDGKLPLMNIVELKNLITTGKLIANAALERKESRGSHYREDYPFIDRQYDSQIIIKSELPKEIVLKRKFHSK